VDVITKGVGLEVVKLHASSAMNGMEIAIKNI
jgi:hypothetical protein